MRRIVIVRHGERLDYTFGRDWIEKSFDDEGISSLSIAMLHSALYPYNFLLWIKTGLNV